MSHSLTPKRAYLLIIVLLMGISSCSEFNRLGKNEKRWAFKHPFASLKIRKIKKQCDPIYEAAKKNPDLDTYINGGKLDAYRHMFYMTMFASRIKEHKVLSLGIAHEKDNYLSFLKNQKEETEVADSISCEMDLRNNETGIRLAGCFPYASNIQKTSELCIAVIKNAGGWYIKRDRNGNYVTCDGAIINLTAYKGKWDVPKCLIQK